MEGSMSIILGNNPISNQITGEKPQSLWSLEL